SNPGYPRQVVFLHGLVALARLRPALVAAYVVMVSVAGLAFLFLEPPSRTVFWDAAFDLGHACLFGVLTIATLHVVRQASPDREPPCQIAGLAALQWMP